jgi:hypothetical protein
MFQRQLWRKPDGKAGQPKPARIGCSGSAEICHEHVGKLVLPVKHFEHGLLIDSHHRAIGDCPCRGQVAHFRSVQY